MRAFLNPLPIDLEDETAVPAPLSFLCDDCELVRATLRCIKDDRLATVGEGGGLARTRAGRGLARGAGGPQQ
jgi:hypothetical protein